MRVAYLISSGFFRFFKSIGVNEVRHIKRMTLSRKEKIGWWLIGLITTICVAGLLLFGAIPQALSYHEFADSRTVGSVPNFWDVTSNVPFVLVGLLGLYRASLKNKIKIVAVNSIAYKVFFAGIALVGVGSGYYHLNPDNATLVWDRLPMTIAFMALFSIIVGEFMTPRAGSILLLPLIVFGLLSVLYWHWTETAGNGDLRLYILVQFLPMLLIPVIMVCFESACTLVGGYWLLLGIYLAAKVFEHFDREVFAFHGLMSGHSIKHVVAATGIYVLLLSYERRYCRYQ